MLELSEMIRELRAQLTAAAVQGAGEALQFEVGPIEIEANVAVTKEAGGGGKVRFLVVEGGADGKYAKSETQRITVTLQPTTPGPGGTRTAARISGAEAAGER
ncbi:trypco2 family protein [Streptomyces sp. DSM 116496]|uniref:trypco2 family protein n=1 Tax=Streptomyces stoeckheimensis TaxID=3344656 RepID=UPI0038B3D42E